MGGPQADKDFAANTDDSGGPSDPLHCLRRIPWRIEYRDCLLDLKLNLLNVCNDMLLDSLKRLPVDQNCIAGFGI
ncbi:hypothetical protein V6R98_27775 [Agrobacterium sp. CCNWLW71]|uniref:hypothetical protein n=1 Tax=Agrobacterium sp. CCNWLW155 TaxID=3122395 RepID=UPI002FEF6842